MSRGVRAPRSTRWPADGYCSPPTARSPSTRPMVSCSPRATRRAACSAAERKAALLSRQLDVRDGSQRLVRREVFDDHRGVLADLGDHLEERIQVEQALTGWR